MSHHQDDEIRAQIAKLEAQLSSNKSPEQPSSKSNVLVPDSPQKKAKAKMPDNIDKPPNTSGSLGSSYTATTPKNSKPGAKEKIKHQSSLLNNLNKLNKTRQSGQSSDDDIDYSANRSTSFKNRRENLQEISDRSNMRDEELQIIEQLQHGSKYPEKPDEDCLELEPNSSTRLSQRYIPHSQLSAALSSSYVIYPSAVYSVAKISPGGTSYHVPVQDDWVTIGVVGTGSGIKQTKGKQETNVEDQSGNAHLKLLLFAAEKSERDSDGEMLYSGGSGGAFEKFWKMKQGSVVALLNPDILKPHQGRGNILGVTVVNADSICVIGHSKDYGHCEALKQGGERCPKWIDKRRGKVCEFHMQTGIERTRNNRPEFSSSTGGMGASAKKDRFRSNKATRGFEESDRKFAGFKDPYDTNYTPTYTFSGITTNNSEQNSSGVYGREKEERLKRKRQREVNEGIIKDLSKPKRSRATSKSSQAEPADTRRVVFNSQHVRKIGFNPAGNAHRDQRDTNNDSKQKSLSLKKAPSSQVSKGPAPEEKKEEEVKMVVDIVEKDSTSTAKAPAPPTAPTKGFPTPKIRSKFKSSKRKADEAAPSTSATATATTAASSTGDSSIDSENRNVISKMSQQEISHEQADIEEKLGPKMVEFLRKRAQKSGSGDVQDNDANEQPLQTPGHDEKNELKEGAAQVQRKSVRIQTTSPPEERQEDPTQRLIREKYFPDAEYNEDQHSWLTSLPPPSSETKKDALRFDFSGDIMPQDTQAYLEGMHHHGRDQGSPGYTVDEFLILCGSINISQRILALRSLSHVLLKWYKQEYPENAAEKLNYVQLGKAVLALRFAMNDTNRSIVVAGLSGIASVFLQHLRLDRVLYDTFTYAECASPVLKVYSGQLTLKPEEMRELLSSPLAFLTFRTDLVDTLNDLLKGNAVISDDSNELKKVSSIVYALSRHSIKTASECVNTPLFLERFVRIFIEKPWPSEDQPDSLAIAALRCIASTSRSNAHAVKSEKVVDVASRYLTILPFNSSRKDSWFLAIETLKLMQTLAMYGFVQGVAVIETIGVDCAKWLSNKETSSSNNSTNFVSSLFNVLRMWTICAIDPHHTTPHHVIVWTQVESMIDFTLAGLCGVQDELSLSSIWAYISVWLRGNKGITDKRGWLEEHVDVQSVRNVADIQSRVAADSILSCTLMKEDCQTAAKALNIVNSAAQLISYCGNYSLSEDLQDVLLVNISKADTVTYNYWRSGLDLVGRHLIQSEISDIKLRSALRLLSVLREGDENIMIAVFTHVLKDTPIPMISSITYFPEREVEAAKLTTVPLLLESAKLMLVDGIYAGVSVQSQDLSQISTLTIPHDTNTLLYDKWALKMTLDELSRSADSEALKNLPVDWNYSEVDLVMGGLTLQEMVDRVLPSSSSALLLQLMRIFLLELGVEGGEVFRNQRVQIALKMVLHRALSGLEEESETLEDVQEEAKAGVPFYQLFTDYVGLFESISLGDANTATMLFPPLHLADDYRRLLWVDHANCLKSIRLTWTDFPKWFVGKLLYPIEHNKDVVKAYARAISSRSLSLDMQPLLFWIALHHSALTLWNTQDETLKHDLMVSLLSSHPDVAIVVLRYGNSEKGLKLPNEANASEQEVQRRLVMLKDSNEKLLSDKLGALSTFV
ncbi:hypothetical protein E3P86_00520 [Wallemia ichthyophaga]|uniref:Zinc finger Mcm10/DnaG-type domain-containing protein n=1 Tax=Wallemia ichthyophaga TaxID=245174 RepID=A0A4T0JMV9_WALIC|nr:hypothetical protein E3P86_00520 [Wallemia ichthyophaga]